MTCEIEESPYNSNTFRSITISIPISMSNNKQQHSQYYCDGMAFPLHVTGKKQKNNPINKDGAMKPPT